MDFHKLNFHVHSLYSDGKNTIPQIVKKALKIGLTHLAITDHFSNSWKADVIPTLDSSEKIDSYLEEISECQSILKKGGESLNLIKGIEIDIGSTERYIVKHVDPSRFDIILFEYLETPESIGFIKNIINIWKKSTKSKDFPLLGLAHFDPSYFLHGSLEILMQFMREFPIFFEFNSRYTDCYSRKNELFFKRLKTLQIPISIGSDSHNSRRLGDLKDPVDMINYYELEVNLEHFLKRLKKN